MRRRGLGRATKSMTRRNRIGRKRKQHASFGVAKRSRGWVPWCALTRKRHTHEGASRGGGGGGGTRGFAPPPQIEVVDHGLSSEPSRGPDRLTHTHSLSMNYLSVYERWLVGPQNSRGEVGPTPGITVITAPAATSVAVMPGVCVPRVGHCLYCTPYMSE